MMQEQAGVGRVGEVVGGKYRITRLLGEGGMGAVYEARHDLIGRRFAIKFLHPQLAAHPEILARFRREAQAAGSLENEHIAAVTDFGAAADGAPYIVMEFLEGEDLAKLLARVGPMPITTAAGILIQVCRGLEVAHARGIVHRDLKPENLLVQRRADGSELVKILDFGIAKLRTAEQKDDVATRTGITLGTPYYMPPEQARGQKELDQRADIYALGVILYELLTATKPHTGDNYNAILYSILMQAAPRVETRRPDLPPDLTATIHRAMAAEPNERFGSVGELGHALARHSDRALTPVQMSTGAFASTVAVTPQSNARALSDAGTRAPVSVPLAAPRASKGGLRLLGAGAAVVATVAAGAWVLSQRAGGSESELAPAPAAAQQPAAAAPQLPPPVAATTPAEAPAVPVPPAPASASSAPPATSSDAPPAGAKPAAAPPVVRRAARAAAPERPAAAAPAPPLPPKPAPKDDDLFAP